MSTPSVVTSRSQDISVSGRLVHQQSDDVADSEYIRTGRSSAEGQSGQAVETSAGHARESTVRREVVPSYRVEWETLKREVQKLRKTKRILSFALAVTVMILIVVTATLGALYAKRPGHAETAALQGNLSTASLTTSTFAYSDAFPVPDSKLGAAVLTLSDMFTPSSSGPSTQLAYNADKGRICIRTKSEKTWHNNVRCVEGADPLPNSPLTIIDWLGGPSIFYFTSKYILAGIDHIPANDTWRVSSVNKYQISVHNQSQIASVTWLNGTSVWLYYQQPDERVREFGLDDYRDSNWRDGSVGPLALGTTGCGLGVTRWINGTDEIEEVFFQQGQGTLAGRQYRNSVWTPDTYAIDGTPNTLPNAVSVSVTTLLDGSSGNGTVVLVYVDSSGFIAVQTRATRDAPLSDLGGFSSKVQAMEGDGQPLFGLAVVGLKGAPLIYVTSKKAILELSSGSISGGNWTSTTI